MATGDGDAASEVVAATDGAVAVVYSPVTVTLSDGEVTYSSYADLSQAKSDADDAVTDFFGTDGAGEDYANSTEIATAIGAAADGDTPASGLMAVLAGAQSVEGAKGSLLRH